MASSRWRYLPWCRSSPTLARDTTASLSRGALALAKAVACGDGFIVVVIEHGGLWAVGLGSESQLGLGKDAHQLLPVRMGGGLTRPSPWWRLDSDTQPQFQLQHFIPGAKEIVGSWAQATMRRGSRQYDWARRCLALIERLSLRDGDGGSMAGGASRVVYLVLTCCGQGYMYTKHCERTKYFGDSGLRHNRFVTELTK